MFQLILFKRTGWSSSLLFDSGNCSIHVFLIDSWQQPGPGRWLRLYTELRRSPKHERVDSTLFWSCEQTSCLALWWWCQPSGLSLANHLACVHIRSDSGSFLAARASLSQDGSSVRASGRLAGLIMGWHLLPPPGPSQIPLVGFWQPHHVPYQNFPLWDNSCKRLLSCLAKARGFGQWLPNSVGFPGVSDSKESVCNAGDLGSIPGLGRSPGEGNGNPLLCSCLENSVAEEPGGLLFMGSQRVGHGWVTEEQQGYWQYVPKWLKRQSKGQNKLA